MSRVNDYLFVYGSLRPQKATGMAAELVSRLKHIGLATARGRLYDFGDYAGAIVEASSDAVIHGDVFELPNADENLRLLDCYEDFDPINPDASLFVRKTTEVKLSDGQHVNAWIYVYNGEPGDARLIADGAY